MPEEGKLRTSSLLQSRNDWAACCADSILKKPSTHAATHKRSRESFVQSAAFLQELSLN